MAGPSGSGRPTRFSVDPTSTRSSSRSPPRIASCSNAAIMPTSRSWEFDIVEGGAERFDTIARALAQVVPLLRVRRHPRRGPPLPNHRAGRRRLRGRPATRRCAPGVGRGRHPQAGWPGRHDRSRPSPAPAFMPPRPPRSFRRDLIVQAYAQRDQLTQAITDDAQLVEALGHPCAIVEGSSMNLKITTQADLRLASLILQANPKPQREGPIHPVRRRRPRMGRRAEAEARRSVLNGSADSHSHKPTGLAMELDQGTPSKRQRWSFRVRTLRARTWSWWWACRWAGGRAQPNASGPPTRQDRGDRRLGHASSSDVVN